MALVEQLPLSKPEQTVELVTETVSIPEQDQAAASLKPTAHGFESEEYAISRLVPNLVEAAHNTAKGKGTEALPRAKAFRTNTTALGAAGAMQGSVSLYGGLTNSMDATTGVGLLLGAAMTGTLVFEGKYSNAKAKKPSNAMRAYGYRLECLRTPRKYRPNLDPDAKVNVHIVERIYAKPAEEPAELAKARLTVALEASLQAREQGAPIGKIIIPEATATKAGLNTTQARPYAEVMPECTKEKVIPPTNDKVLVVGIGELEQLIKQLKASYSDEKFTVSATATLAALVDRFPSRAEFLDSKNPRILKELHGLIRRITSGDSNASQKLEHEYATSTITRTNEKGVKETRLVHGRTGDLRRVRIDSYPSLDATDPYDPTIIHLNTQTGEPLSSTKLSDLITSSETSNQADLKLIHQALKALEQPEEEESKSTDQPLLGVAPKPFEIESPDPRRNLHRLKAIGRTAVALAAIGSTLTGAFFGPVSILDKVAGSHESMSSTSYFRIDNHGLALPSAHWPTTTQYEYREGTWRDSATTEDGSIIIPVPESLSDPSIPHITVSGMSSEPSLNLPFQEGSRIAALHIKNPNGESLGAKLERAPDGQYIANVDESSVGDYSIQYDLIKDPNSYITAYHPLQVYDSKSLHGARFPRSDNVRQAADYIIKNFIYDASPALHNRLRQDLSPGTYAREVYKAKRCDCNKCNTAVALAESTVRPSEKLAHVSGVLHPVVTKTKQGDTKIEKHGYLVEKHAWLADDRGTVDATATETDTNSAILQYSSIKELDEAWDDGIKVRNLESSLGGTRSNESPPPINKQHLLLGIGSLLAAVVERRYRPMRKASRLTAKTVVKAVDQSRQFTANQYILPAKAVEVLAQQTFGDPARLNAAVFISNTGRHVPIQKGHLPTRILKQAKQGEFFQGNLTRKEATGVRLTAALMLDQRNREEHRTWGRIKIGTYALAIVMRLTELPSQPPLLVDYHS